MDPELARIARSLVWWKPPEEVDFHYLVRRVMNMGTFEMQRYLAKRHGGEIFATALRGAELGEFSPQAWNYWHLRLGIRPTPPLPRREVPESPYVSPELIRSSRTAAKTLAKTVVQDLPNTYSVAFKQELEGANISFFGTQDYGQTATPLIADGNGIKVAALVVMLAMKLKVLHERVAAKDYLDVAALVRAGISLEDGLSHLEALFPNSINPALTMQTLAYFKGGDLDTLPDDVKRDLETAVSRVREVPPFTGTKTPIGFCSAKT